MGDFISNNPDGKSDLHKFASPAEPRTSTEPPIEESPKTQRPDEASAAQQPTAEPPTQSATQPIQGQYQYQNPSQNPYQYAAYSAPPPTKSPKDGYNVASLVLGIVAWAGLVLCCGCISPFAAIASIITAFMGRENGKFSGKAVAGIILSIIFLVIFAFFMLILILGMSGTFDDPEVSGDLVEMMIAFISNKRF